MTGKINWAVIIPPGVFVLVPWPLQSALGTLYAADEQAGAVG